MSVKVLIMAAWIFGWHSMHKYGVEIVDVCNKYVLHGFEGADGECTREVGVHCTCFRLARAAKQNMSWAAQISLPDCRLLTSCRALTMAGYMVPVD
jgi:hypothetical protein